MWYKKKVLFIGLILLTMVIFPGTAFAKADQYGYDAQNRSFKGTLDNWEAFLRGLPPTPFSWQQKDTDFIERKWDKLFDPMIHGQPPQKPGAWQKAKAWRYLSGDQLGWTWHLELEIVYSPNTPISGARVVPEEEVGITGFYFVQYNEWLTDPHGKKTVIQNLQVDRKEIIKALKICQGNEKRS